MKSFLYVIMLLLGLVLGACTPSLQVPEPATAEHGRSVEGLSPTLAAIDSLMWRQPDSALACILPCFDTCRDARFCVSTATPYNRHYANLLLAELLYKNDYAQINRAELLQAVAYFDSLVREAPPLKGGWGDSKRTRSRNDNLVFLDARTHYINGVGYYEKDSVIEACKEYLKALEVMEGCFEEKELVEKKATFMAMTYTRLTEVFTDLYLNKQAIYFGKLSIPYYERNKTSLWHLSWMLSEIGANYNMMEVLDSASYYYQQAVSCLPDTTNQMYRDIVARQAFLSYMSGESPLTSINQLRMILAQAKSEQDKLSRCLAIGEIFYHEKQYDSAWVYLDKVFRESTTIGSKKQAAEWLAEICKVKARDTEILEYAEFLTPFATIDENQGALKSQLAELYNSYRQASLSRQHQQALKKNLTIGLILFFGLIVGLLAYILLYHNNKRQKQSLEKQIKEEQVSHNIKMKALSGRLKQSNQKLQETLKRIEIQETKYKTTESHISYNTIDERYEAFRQSPICHEILGIVNNLHANKRVIIKTNSDITEYKAHALSLSQTAQLTKTAETFFPHLYTVLKTQYASLDRKEWLHCCLYLLQIDKMSICVLLQEPYYSCRRYTLKMEKAFGCRHGLGAFLIEQSASF